jgi:8-oxo-dGTP pyrophosphatase MutT (NUDIX family)
LCKRVLIVIRMEEFTDFSDLVALIRSRIARADESSAYVDELNVGGESARRAAVALVLRGNLSEAEMLVIKRSVSERDHWSGHLALPGGRVEAGDASLLATAVRETFEEVGVNLQEGGEVLGRLGVVEPKSPLAPRVSVAPFVAVAPAEYHVRREGEVTPPLVLSEEVAAAFWVPVAALKAGGRSEVFKMVFAGVEREWPAYPSEHGPIWGITERILTEFLGVLNAE